MTVNSGVTKEGNVYGLAHFTEHMLFLGSKKYPNPTKFVDYITQYNGVFNGYTDFDITAFYFSIHPDYFEKGLDIFSRFFIDPLFDKQYILKEVNSVNSEFERNIQVDMKRKEQVLRNIANKKSFFHRFTTGNNQTLLEYTKEKKIDLRDEVVNYYKENYTPENMKLIIYGNKDVEFYKDIVKDSFSDLKFKEESPSLNNSEENELPFSFFNEGKFVIYESISHHQLMEINFMIPDIFQSLPHNIGTYFKILLNYKGKGSLVDVLTKNGLASDLLSGMRKTYDGWSLFRIRLSLTKKGIINVHRVIKLIFKYLDYLRSFSKNKKLYNFIKRHHDIKYLFLKKSKSPLSFVAGMCMAILKYKRKDLLSQHQLLYTYDSFKISEFGNHFIIKNSIVLLGNKQFDHKLRKNFPWIIKDYINRNNEEFLEKEPWYKTKYTQFKFSDKFINDLEENRKHPKVYGFSKDFLFLRKKKKIRNVSLLRSCAPFKRKTCLKKFREDALDLSPINIIKNNRQELWYKKDRSFLVSRMNFFTKFILPEEKFKSPTNSIMLKIFNHGIKIQFRNFIYEQKMKRAIINIHPKNNGFSVKIYSFSQNILKISEEFYMLLRNSSITKNTFILVKDSLRKSIMRRLNLSPRLRAYLNFFKLVLRDFVRNKELLKVKIFLIKELDKLKFEDFSEFSKEMFGELYIKSFIHGNCDSEISLELFERTITENFNEYNAIDQSHHNYKNPQANLNGYHVFREKLPNKYNINHAILNFYQIGKSNLQNIILAHLIRFLCGNIYFTQLRIKEQLGYVTSGKVFSSGGNIYYLIIIQGSKKTPDKMDVRIENVVKLMRNRLEDVKTKKFDKFLSLIIKRISIDRSMIRRSNRLWNEILSKRNYFNLKSKVKKLESTIKKTDLLNFFDKIFEDKLKKLSIQEFSTKIKEIPEKVGLVRGIQGKLINDNNYFRKREKFI